jgi:hypothetical protein
MTEPLPLEPPELTGYTHPVLGEHTYDFYRCQRCQRLVTQREMILGLSQRSGIAICPCGALKFSPTQVTWRDYRLEQVIRFARERYSDQAVRADLRAEMADEGYGWLARAWQTFLLLEAQFRVAR